MRIFITGGNGQVAYEIVHLAQQKKHRILAPSRDVLDITDSKAVTRAVQEFHPDVVINAAAYTRVDQAEKEQAEAYAVNCEGAKNLAIVCAEIERPLLHLSTDYVFDGKKTHPYLETDPIAPVNLYGDSKWQGEEAIREQCEQHIILRTSAVFGSHGVNFVKTILRLASEREELRIVADQITCPTPASAIAETLLKLATFSRWGTYHYCGSPAVSWYDFEKKIIQLAEMAENS